MTPPPASEPDRRPRWVVLANAARARIVERDPDNGALREIGDLVHPASRARASELGRDRPGLATRGSQRTPFAAPTDPSERERAHFVQQLADHLETAVHEGRLPPWALLASSPFLGRLRAGLGRGAAAQLVRHADRDLSALPLHELEPRLREWLPPGPAPEREAAAS